MAPCFLFGRLGAIGIESRPLKTPFGAKFFQEVIVDANGWMVALHTFTNREIALLSVLGEICD
jgi:hypothetical protein